MKVLEKTRAVLPRRYAGKQQVVFRLPPVDEDDDYRSHIVKVDRLVWEDMGSPSEITVTIEPGDHLNG